METELTKKIKIACRGFKPEMPTQMRTIRYAEEVWTPTGIVDVIRFEDYKKRDYSLCCLIDYNQFDKHYQEMWRHQNQRLGECKIEGQSFPNKHCDGCVWHSRSYDVGMLVTCYEVKISVADFKSPNGHNFHGNKNYYAVDSRIYEDIKGLVPEDIGIIVFYEKTGAMRIKKECKFQEISYELKAELLYNEYLEN